MTWFDDGAPAEYLEVRDKPKIALWPMSEKPRIDPRYRLLMGEGLPAPRANNYFVRFIIEDGPPEVIKNCSIPLVPIGDQELEGTSGVSADGFEFILNIRPHTTPDPVFSVYGLEHTITYKHAGFPDFFVRQMYGNLVGDPVPPLGIKVQNPLWSDTLGPFWFSTDYDPLVNTDVDVAIMENNWRHFPYSECIDLAPAPVEGQADFNGVDATYHLDTFNAGPSERWRFEYDIKANTAAEIVVLGFSGTALVQHNWSGRFCAWRSFLVDTTNPLPVGVWIHIDFDFQWLVDLNDTLRVFKDGVPAGTAFFNATTTGGDRFGQRAATFVGDFSLKNFKLLHEGVTTPRVEIDCPMNVNACDIGPQMLGGTTANMTLPSCPP